VDRHVDPGDARAWIISLTETGEQQLANMRTALGSSLQPYLAVMSSKDRKALREGITAMRRLMGIEGASR
jgi:DNA-binding MarR family transcriptional regulator